MVSSDELVSKGLKSCNFLLLYDKIKFNPSQSLSSIKLKWQWTANNLTDLHINSFVKIFMFLNKGFHTVQGVTLVITGEEGFPSCHPVLSLLTVPVEELQKRQTSISRGSKAVVL